MSESQLFLAAWMTVATCGVLPHHTAAQNALSLPQYIAELDRLHSRIRTAEASDASAILAETPPVKSQVDVGEQQFDVSFSWLRHSLAETVRNPPSWPERRSSIVSRLDALRREAATLQANAAVTQKAEADATLRRILDGSEFRRDAASSALSILRQRIWEKLRDFWRRLGGDRISERITATAVAWVVGVAALVALVSVLLRLLLNRTDQPRLTIAPSPSLRKSARSWALQALASEDPRDIARCAYRAAVVRLEEEGAWKADDTRTPREHLRLLPDGHRRRHAVKDIIARFEASWFGAKRPTDDDTRSILARLRELGCLPAE